jgi:hypothetical protein
MFAVMIQNLISFLGPQIYGNNNKQEVLGRTNRLLSLIKHRPHRRRRVTQFFYCGVCVRCRGNVFTKLLPSNNMGDFYRAVVKER